MPRTTNHDDRPPIPPSVARRVRDRSRTDGRGASDSPSLAPAAPVYRRRSET